MQVPSSKPAWLDGRVAVVTGASRGIGRSTSVELAAAGAHVFAAARTTEKLNDLQDQIEAAGGTATAVRCDVSVPEDVDGLFAAANEIAAPSVLVCCAGAAPRGLVDEMPVADFNRAITVNLTGTYLCCRLAIANMKKAGGGKIITFSSLSGVYATEKFPGLAAYNASKAGVVGLTEGIAVEGKPHGISAVCISPGAVDTQMLKEANPDLKAGLSADDVGRLVAVLLHDSLVPISGANVPLFSNL